MKIDEFQENLYIWASENAGLQDCRVVWLDEANPKLRKPFIGLKLIDGPDSRGFEPEIRWKKPDPKPTLSRQKRFTLSVNVYGRRALSVADSLRDSLDIPTVYETFCRAGFSVVSVGLIRDLTELLDTKFEKRAQFDIGILLASNTIFDLEAIEHVTVDGTVNGKPVSPGVTADEP